MPAFTVMLTRVVRRHGRIYVNFEDGAQYEDGSVVGIRAWAEQGGRGRIGTHQKCLEYALGRDGTLSDLSAVQGKRFTYDPADAEPIRVTANG